MQSLEDTKKFVSVLFVEANAIVFDKVDSTVTLPSEANFDNGVCIISTKFNRVAD